MFQDEGVPDLTLPALGSPQDKGSYVTENILPDLVEYLMLYRCRLNAAGMALAQVPQIQACANFSASKAKTEARQSAQIKAR